MHASVRAIDLLADWFSLAIRPKERKKKLGARTSGLLVKYYTGDLYGIRFFLDARAKSGKIIINGRLIVQELQVV